MVKIHPATARLNRIIAKKNGDKTYTGKECPKCGTNERWVKGGCIRCNAVRKLKERRRTPTKSYDRMLRWHHHEEWMKTVFGDQTEHMIARYLKNAKHQAGVAPDRKEVYAAPRGCKHDHAPIRYITTGKCFVCEQQQRLYRDIAKMEEKAVEEEVALDYWATTPWGNDPDRPRTLPEHLYCGKPCRHGHPGLRYKSTRGCWHCLEARDRRTVRPVPVGAWVALVA